MAKIQWYLILFILLISCEKHETNGYGADIEPPSPYEDPVWHPSGKIIGFNHMPIKEIYYHYGYDHPGMATYIYETDSVGFWLINADGTNQRRVLPYKLFTPAWSPDGNWIAFSRWGQIFKMPFDGNQFDTMATEQLTLDGQNSLPAWSPDGEWIAYHEAICNDTKACGIWIKNLESGKDEFVGLYGIYPDWHPHRNSLAYFTNHLTNTGDDIGDFIWLYDNISETKQLLIDITTPNYDNRYLQYSPDGKKIAFISALNPGGGVFLYTINIDGAGLKKLTSSWVTNFSWSPQGKIVYLNFDFKRIDDTQGTLWIMDADGSNKKQLTHNNFQIFQ